MGYKAAVQILKQAEDLKNRVLKKSDLLTDSQAWTDQQKLQTIYHQALVLDLEYALDKKVEQDLWNIGFKNHITILQEQARDKKNLRRSECQALLTWCLEAASGFYLTLLHELCNLFDIDLPFRRRGNVYGETNFSSDLNLPQSSSCIYICQYCLVHLGDIARYRNQRKQAENFYKQAIQVSPSSGHPYNQLALLEASQGDKLSTVFYYIRGIAVKNPFPASSTNLLSILSSLIDKDNPLEKVASKITVNEFIQIFLTTHGLLHTASDLNQAEIGVKSLNSTMTALVATQSFTIDKLLKITAINLYALKHVTSTCLTDELTEDEKIVKKFILDLLAGSLSAFLIPVHTLKNDESLLDYYALPAVKLLTYWIKNEPSVLQESVFTNRLQIWPSLCKLLNNVQSYLKNFDYEKFVVTPLYEDRMLQGFRPLIENYKELDFRSNNFEDEKVEKLIRMKRLLDFGIFISDLNLNLITKVDNTEKILFEPGCIQPDPTNDLLEEMKSFNITEKFEKRVGILKPQGSLEKSREEPIELKKETKKRTKQNIAIQSIYKKLEENKQVKFNVDEKEPIDTKQSLPSTSQFRTQSFNQNHPAFPLPPPNDYLNTLRNVTKPPPQNFMFKNEPPPPAPPINYQQSSSLFNTKPPQRVPSYPFGVKVEEPPPPPNWWPPNNYPNFFGGNFVPDYKTPNQAGGDMFNSAWGGTYENMNMRQTMLKESVGRDANFMQNNTPGYSLFNTNTWTPNLVGQLRNKSQENQHSLFTGQGPQSLAQLLEQQQLQKND